MNKMIGCHVLNGSTLQTLNESLQARVENGWVPMDPVKYNKERNTWYITMVKYAHGEAPMPKQYGDF